MASEGVAECVRLSFPPRPEHVALARMIAVAVAERAGLSPERIEDVRLVVSEVCTNAVEAQIRRRVEDPITLVCVNDGSVRLEVSDAAGGFDGGAYDEFPDPNHVAAEHGGWGIPITRRLADTSSIAGNGRGGTTVTVEVRP